MRKLSIVVAGVLTGLNAAVAADMRALRQPLLPPPPLWSWSGLYIGGHLGGGVGVTKVVSPDGAPIFGDDIRTPTVAGGMQVGVNWQPAPNWVLGVEADISALNANGTNTCFATSGLFASANCRVRQDAMATVTGRLGLAAGPGGLSLFYAKGGAAWLRENIDIASNPLGFSTSQANDRWGWTAGAGFERALAPAWSVRMEYDYANFGRTQLQTPESTVLQPTGFVPTPGGSTTATLAVQTVKLGLNMKFGGDAYARWDGLDTYSLRGAVQPTVRVAALADIEIGGRVWYSSGRFQKDLGATTDVAFQNVLNSRLTYADTAVSGEIFGRIDGQWNTFLKGFVGGGKLLGVKMNDEDWIPSENIPYSNTLSNPVSGSIGYATLDAGYNFLRGAGFKVGGFVGYNYYRDNKSAYGCTQIAGAPVCDPAIANSTLVIAQDDKWQSMRLGINGVVMLTDQLTLTADAAYLPLVTRSGVDNHALRTEFGSTLSPESGTGQGVQLEAILSYAFSRSFSVGAGARYWAMWTTNDDARVNYFGFPCPCNTLPARTERYGGFVEASYKFNGLR